MPSAPKNLSADASAHRRTQNPTCPGTARNRFASTKGRQGMGCQNDFMKNKTTVIHKIQRGSMVSLAVLAAVKLTSVNALAENIEVNSDLPSAVTKSARISHVEPGKVMNVVFVLGLKDPNGASEFARRVSTPDDPLYGKFLTPEQFG